jgi:hypothetical protein
MEEIQKELKIFKVKNINEYKIKIKKNGVSKNFKKSMSFEIK